MMPKISVMILCVITCHCVATSTATAQQDRRLPLVMPEELSPPRGKVDILDVVPPQRRRIGQFTPEENARVQRIDRMLTQLKRLAKERESAKEQNRLQQQPVMPLVIDNPSNTMPPAEIPRPLVTTPPKIQELPTVIDSPVQTQSAATDTQPVSLTSTVDSLALANNLFAQGKIDMARPIYEKLVKTPQSASDSIWTKYQLACCYRIDGRIKDATRLYRIVGTSKAEAYWAGRAHWWLDFLGRAQQIEAQRQSLEKQLELLKEATREPKAK